jgi:hypothetical protein
LIVGQHIAGESQGAADVQDAAAIGINDAAVGDRQPGDGHCHPAGDAEDPAGVVAADGQVVGARAFDIKALRLSLRFHRRDRLKLRSYRGLDSISVGSMS